VTRNLPFQSGDWVSTSAVVKGEQNLQSVELFRRATVVLPESLRSQPEIPVRVTVTEAEPRFTGLQLGYVTAGAGVSAQGRWTHPNFTGDSRSLNFVWLVQTGWGNFGEVPDRLARATLTLRQPYIANPKLSFSVGPKAEWRDDDVERSTRTSGLGTLLYQFDILQSVALTYDFTVKNLLDLRFGGISLQESQLSGLLSDEVLDQLKGPQHTSQIILTANRGKLDEIALPRHGIVFKPSLATTVPGAWSDLHFMRGDILATAFFPVPLGTSAFMLRA
jgi:outer membrane protein assembly factor BamA